MDLEVRRRSSTIIPGIIILNTLVFIMWTFSDETGISPMLMMENFLVSWSSLTEGRYWTLISSAFSHNMFWHFLLNMFVLSSFGPIVEELLGFWRFVTFYFAAAIISSLSHALVSAWLIGDPDIPALGASGAISGLILIFSLAFPKEKILLMGLIPVPAFIGAILFIGLDVWGLYAQAGGGGLPIGHGAHLGGAITGIIYYLLFLKNSRDRWAIV